MKISVSLAFLGCLVGLALFISGIVVGESVPSGTFSGSETFNTEEEYTQFKVALALTDWDLQKVRVLHSDPPVLVEFHTYDATHSFPYGTEGITVGETPALYIPGMVFMFVSIISLSLLLEPLTRRVGPQ